MSETAASGILPSSTARTSEAAEASLDGSSRRSADEQSVAEGYEAAAAEDKDELTRVSFEVSVEAVAAFGAVAEAEALLELLPHRKSSFLRGNRSHS